jgi:hypothetical protein
MPVRIKLAKAPARVMSPIVVARALETGAVRMQEQWTAATPGIVVELTAAIAPVQETWTAAQPGVAVAVIASAISASPIHPAQATAAPSAAAALAVAARAPANPAVLPASGEAEVVAAVVHAVVEEGVAVRQRTSS